MPDQYSVNPNEIFSVKAVVNAGWDDAPWLSREVKDEMLKETPPHLKDARSKGIPGMGSGNVYPIDVQSLVVPSFEIPAWYKRLYALDVGWNKTAALFGALNPDDDVLYIYSEHYMGHAEPHQHVLAIRERLKAAGYEFFGFIDPASRGRSQNDGTKLIDVYRRDHGLKIIPANNEVESGIYRVYERCVAGKLKIFEPVKNFQNEWVLYRRDLNGKIIKEKDHLMDCLRYMVASLQYAKARPVANTAEAGYGGRVYRI